MFKKQKFINLALKIAVMCLTTIFVASAIGQEKAAYIGGDNVKSLLFNDANEAMKAAKTAQAEILAPKNFGEAMKYYREAEKQVQKGDNLDDIRKNLRESVGYFDKAIEATKLAEVTFPNLLKARKDAQYTGSPKFASKLWTDAEKKFNGAAGELEGGDVNDAREEAAEAETLYRKAELASIKANYLDETRILLTKADKLDVEDRAPKTLKLAQQLVKQAEKELNENRYDTDVARSMARQANYEVKHAIYLAGVIKELKDKDQTWEDLMLASEKPLRQIAEKSEMNASFETGPANTTDAIITYVGSCQNKIIEQNRQLDYYHVESDLLEARVAEMEKMYGSQAKEKSKLAQQIANQAKTQELFTQMERSFSPKEARVLREDNDIIIRLVGLNFLSSEATIEQKSFALLTKVRDAIYTFPKSTVSVQGHTDSFGGDAQNLVLSTERAESVKQYLMANSKLVTSQIEAYGFGESKPIATNETTAGRAANRRVDVVIHPAVSTSLVTVK